MNISIRDVHFGYDAAQTVLRGIAIEIHRGERVALIGQNGSGKTTLVKHLNGLVRPTRGEVIVGDWNTRAHSVAQMARRVGLVFQNPEEQIFKNRVADEIAFGLANLGLTRDEIAQRVDAVLTRTALTACRDAHPYELLASQRRWVALASILALDTPILILDEPTTGQDAAGLTRLGALVNELTREGKTIIAITHDMDWCAEHFDRVIVLKQGRVLVDGDPHQIFAQTDLLAETFIEPPQITRLGMALGFSETVLTVDEFLQMQKNVSTASSQ
jgi:energy-coupling factor transport system ATP-binding protein